MNKKIDLTAVLAQRKALVERKAMLEIALVSVAAQWDTYRKVVNEAVAAEYKKVDGLLAEQLGLAPENKLHTHYSRGYGDDSPEQFEISWVRGQVDIELRITVDGTIEGVSISTIRVGNAEATLSVMDVIRRDLSTLSVITDKLTDLMAQRRAVKDSLPKTPEVGVDSIETEIRNIDREIRNIDLRPGVIVELPSGEQRIVSWLGKDNVRYRYYHWTTSGILYQGAYSENNADAKRDYKDSLYKLTIVGHEDIDALLEAAKAKKAAEFAAAMAANEAKRKEVA